MGASGGCPLSFKLMTSSQSTTWDFFQERLQQGQKIGVINLGCARNLVDSQTILGRLKREGHHIVPSEQADVAIVNTCSFIEEAKQESLDMIVHLLEQKKQGKIKKVIIAGCLAQRYAKELAEEFKEADAIIGTLPLDKDQDPQGVQLTPTHSAYVKICESCYNQCSFCIIPKLKGKFISRTIESVVKEVKRLEAQGVKEINIIGQDITAYGMDIYREKKLAALLKALLAQTSTIRWFRLLYAFPAHVTDELIEVMASDKRICQYIDVPLQHISDHLLISMNRNITKAETIELMQKFRAAMPQGSLRTTFITGLPGETDADFEELVDFVRMTRFEKMGVFIYSHEEGTAAFSMPDQVEDGVRQKRMKALMALQQGISQEVQEGMIGRQLTVMIEEKLEKEEGVYVARSEYDAPEVDGVVYVHTDKVLSPGDFVEVTIMDALEYDLIGELA